MKRCLSLLSLFVTLALPVQGWAAISEIGTQVTYAWTAATTTPTLANYTTTTGTQKTIGVMLAAYTENSALVSSVTIDGTAGAVCPSTAGTDGALITSIWRVNLGTHTGGSKTVSVVFTANTNAGFVTLVELDGVDQTTPCARGTAANGVDPAAPSITLTSVASGELSYNTVSGYSGAGNGTPGGTATHVEIRDELGGGGTLQYVGKNTTATGTVVMSWTTDGGTWRASGAVFAPAAGGGGGPTPPPLGTLGLMGVGR